MHGVRFLVFDWGDTLMVDDPHAQGPMADWERVAAMPGVGECLPALSCGYRCAVASNAGDSDAAAMGRALARVGLARHFEMFVTSRELGARKPDPRFFQGVLGKLGARPEEACMIGNDYEKDILGAKAAGLRTVLISAAPGQYPRADFVVDSFFWLPEILGL